MYITLKVTSHWQQRKRLGLHVEWINLLFRPLFGLNAFNYVEKIKGAANKNCKYPVNIQWNPVKIVKSCSNLWGLTTTGSILKILHQFNHCRSRIIWDGPSGLCSRFSVCLRRCYKGIQNQFIAVQLSMSFFFRNLQTLYHSTFAFAPMSMFPINFNIVHDSLHFCVCITMNSMQNLTQFFTELYA